MLDYLVLEGGSGEGRRWELDDSLIKKIKRHYFKSDRVKVCR